MTVVNDVMTAIGMISTLSAIIFGYVTFNRTRRKDDQDNGAKSASVYTEMNYVKGIMEEMKRKIELLERHCLESSIHLTHVETDVDKAHERINHLTGNIYNESERE